jgi:peptidoglycan/xylan/chitin deacetylase (PgdA/CDA1 family)
VARRIAKAVLGQLLCWLARLWPRPVGVAVLYHAIADSERERADELVPPTSPRLFARQLELLGRHYRVVPASELQAAAAARRIGGRIPVAITFDDDDHTHPTVAARLLREAGLSATFFVNAESLDSPRPLWWQQLQRAWDEDAIDAELLALIGLPPGRSRHRLALIGATITQLRPNQRERVRAALRERVGDDPALDGLSRDELRGLAASGFELGCHTTRHDFLPVLTAEELDDSVTSGRAEIEEVAGRPVRVFAYPSGGWDATARGAVQRAGYVAAFTALGGVVTPHSDRFALPRLSPPTGYVAELSYVLGRTLWEPGPETEAAQ